MSLLGVLLKCGMSVSVSFSRMESQEEQSVFTSTDIRSSTKESQDKEKYGISPIQVQTHPEDDRKGSKKNAKQK